MDTITRRRALQTGCATVVVGLAGCSNVFGLSPPLVDRLVLRSDTGETEPITSKMTYAPKEGSTVQSQAVQEAPASGEIEIIDLDEDPGFYNVYAEAQNHDSSALLSFNSHKSDAPSHDLQFEFIVKENGSLYSNIAKSESGISIPGMNE